MNDINRVFIIGRLTADPSLRYTQGGTSIASMSLANNKSFTQNNERKEQVSYFNLIAWGKTGEIMAQHCKKGVRIGVEGRMQQRAWQDKDGAKRSTVEIVVENFQFLSDKKDGDTAKPQEPDAPREAEPEELFNNQASPDEDIPY